MKFLVIGCGSIGERHIRNLKSLFAGKILACDINTRHLHLMKKKYNAEIYENVEEALDQSPDAVLVCTPTNLHIPIALHAAKKGCHLFIEKPISHNLEGVDELLDLAEKKGLIIFVGFNMKFNANIVQIKKLLDEGKIGKIISARVHFGSYLPDRHPWEDYRKGYGARKSLGGGVILDAIHEIELIQWFLGEIEEIFCFADKMSGLEIDVEDTAEIFFKFKSGAVATLHLDFIQRPYRLSCELIGDRGTIKWTFAENIVYLYNVDTKQWETFPGNVDPYDMYIREVEHFVKCINGQEKPLINGILGKKILKIALAAKKSAEIGDTVKI